MKGQVYAMNLTSGIVIAVVGLGSIGCGASMPMERSKEIQIVTTPFIGRRYTQYGVPIDPADMADKLEQEPEAGSHASRARALGVVSTILAGIGGGLIGVPLGQAIVGERKPLWPLAIAGGGAIAISIPLAIWGVSSMNSAVEAHNRTIVIPSGFTFGDSKLLAAVACQKAGHQWSDEGGAHRCSGTPSAEIPGASARLEFADGALSSVELVIRPADDVDGWVSSFGKTEAALTRLYGAPTQRVFELPEECKAAEQFLGCVVGGKVKGSASWPPRHERAVTMTIVGSPSPSTIRVRIKRVRPKG